MTIGYQRIAPGASLLDEDDVLPMLQLWRGHGLRTALVTLIGVEGGAPRQPGAQMAVTEDGRYVGYLSGGCLEQAVALEARDVIAQGVNRVVRYGKGSSYFDIRLPCGSGLDLYFDQALDDRVLAEILDNRRRRHNCALRILPELSGCAVVAMSGNAMPSRREGEAFIRVYPAPLRLALLGNGPALTGIAALAQATGLELVFWSTDEVTRSQLQAAGHTVSSGDAALDALTSSLDTTSAAVVIFHDHDAEPHVLRKLLATPCFYLGVLGNHAVHRTRLDALRQCGVADADLARLHAPVGTIANAKSKTTFAFGVLTEMLTVAKQRHLIA